VQARIEGVSHKFPQAVLVSLNDRNPQLHDLYRIDITTGQKELVLENEGFLNFVTDDDYRPRLAMRLTPEGGSQIFTREGAEWAPFAEISAADGLTTAPLGLDEAGDALYMLDSRGRNTAALVRIDLASRAAELLAEDGRADVSEALAHPVRKQIEAVAFNYDRKHWKVLDPAMAEDFAYLETVAAGDFEVTSRTLDDRKWIVAYLTDAGPVRYYLYERPERRARFLFSSRPALENLPLARMHPVMIRSRDGLELVSYLTLPVGTDPDQNARPDKPLPMVLWVHGGPWAREEWGYHPYHQWLSNRGYAVLAVNFRGSTGFGKQFVNAGDREWGARMHDDLVDAVEWAVRERIADAGRIGIMGGSYGGYATLVGLTLTPELFACGVDIVGPSSLVTLLESVPPYWKPLLDLFTQRIGDHRTEEGRAFLLERSPITHVERIKRPLLIGQGANDPRVKQAEADQIVQAMRAKNIPVTYVLFPDEGHGFARPENSLAFNAIAEAFLAAHLGGRYEPIGDDFGGASVQVPTGAEAIPALREALAGH
jgi:dipeptidyl aminopeptidase/acylaminoacyl peptidase